MYAGIGTHVFDEVTWYEMHEFIIKQHNQIKQAPTAPLVQKTKSNTHAKQRRTLQNADWPRNDIIGNKTSACSIYLCRLWCIWLLNNVVCVFGCIDFRLRLGCEMVKKRLKLSWSRYQNEWLIERDRELKYPAYGLDTEFDDWTFYFRGR